MVLTRSLCFTVLGCWAGTRKERIRSRSSAMEQHIHQHTCLRHPHRPGTVSKRLPDNGPATSHTGTIVITASFYHTFYYAISKGEVSLTGTLVAGYPMITVLLSGLFLGERLEPVQYLGVGLVVAGVVLVALPEKRMSEKLKDLSWIVWGLACAFLIGAGDFLTKLSINRIGAYSHILFLAVVSNPMGGLNYLIDRKERSFPDIRRKKALPTLTGLVVMSIGTLLFILSFDYGKVSLIAPVSSIYPAIIAVLAAKFLGEKITAKQGTGIGIIVAGLVLIGLGTF